MDAHRTLQAQPPSAHHAYTTSVSYKRLLRRCATLEITQKDVGACRNVAELQVLAKTRYRALARRYHPDAQAQRTAARWGRFSPQLTGHRFRLVASAYAWIMDLPSEQLVHAILPCMPIAETVLPWALERKPLVLGNGWQETPVYW